MIGFVDVFLQKFISKGKICIKQKTPSINFIQKMLYMDLDNKNNQQHWIWKQVVEENLFNYICYVIISRRINSGVPTLMTNFFGGLICAYLSFRNDLEFDSLDSYILLNSKNYVICDKIVKIGDENYEFTITQYELFSELLEDYNDFILWLITNANKYDWNYFYREEVSENNLMNNIMPYYE